MTTAFEIFTPLCERLFRVAAAILDPPHAGVVEGILEETREDFAARRLGPRPERWILNVENVVTRGGREQNRLETDAPELWNAMVSVAAFYSSKPSFFDLRAEELDGISGRQWRGPAWTMSTVTEPVVRAQSAPSPWGSFHARAVFEWLGDTVWWIDTSDQIQRHIPGAELVRAHSDPTLVSTVVTHGLPALANAWSATSPIGLTRQCGLFVIGGMNLPTQTLQSVLESLGGDTPARLPLIDRACALCFAPRENTTRATSSIRAVLAAPDQRFSFWLFEGEA